MSAFQVSQQIALSDCSMAIAQDGPNTHSMIYIYRISTDLHNKGGNTQSITSKEETKKRRKHNDGTRNNTKNNDPIVMKKLRYSGEPMDVVYSSRYISMSKDGRYLALSWLPNPRLGENTAMKYCVVYDLNNIKPIIAGDKSDNEVNPEIPCAIFDFQGGCVFTNEGAFVLINHDKALVYSIQSNSSFKLEFSLNMSTTSTTSHIPENDGGEPVFYFFPLQEEEENMVSLDSQNSGTTDLGNDNYDKIFFDSSVDECISDLEDDINEDGIETDGPYKTQENNNDINASTSYQAYLQNKDFIAYNTKNIKDYSIICLVSSALSNNIDSNDLGSETYRLFVWSLSEKRLALMKKLKRGEPQSISNYITALNKQRNMIAVSNINPFISNYNTHQTLETIDSPISTIYDCESGVSIVELHLPKRRIFTSISQILFLQNDTYVLVISHSYEYTFFDIWDIYSAIHLDNCIILKQSFTEYSEFILKRNIPITSGCGVYMQINKISTEGTLTATNNNYTLYTRRIQFFNKNTTEKPCICRKTISDAFNNFTSSLTCYHCPDSSYNLTLWPNTSAMHQSFDFLDNKHRYIMLCQSDPTTTGSDILLMSIWEVCSKSGRKLTCDDICSKRRRQNINFKKLKYSFTLNRNEFIWSQSCMTGHPTMFLNMTAVHEHCIKDLLPVILYNEEPNKTPVLLLEMNHLNISKDSNPLRFQSTTNTEDTTQKNNAFYGVVVPLHTYSGLESHLHALANQTMLSIFDSNGIKIKDYSYEDYVRNTYVNKEYVDGFPTKDKLIKLIRSNNEFFSTLGGYAIICRLAASDENNDILSEILKDTTKVNYCILATEDRQLTDALQEALKYGAEKNAMLVVKHIKYSMVAYGVEYGYLLVKHCELLADSMFLNLSS